VPRSRLLLQQARRFTADGESVRFHCFFLSAFVKHTDGR
jgi:hypothetical protein